MFSLANDCIGEEAGAKAAALQTGRKLVENLRFYVEEEGKPRGLQDARRGEEGCQEKAVKESEEFTKRLPHADWLCKMTRLVLSCLRFYGFDQGLLGTDKQRCSSVIDEKEVKVDAT